MKLRLCAANLLAVLLATAPIAAFAQGKEVTLKVGDPAPKLQVASWVQGDPVKNFEADKAYIVEFWATWCGPCRVSIPHVNQLHAAFKDKGLVVIGQDVWEKEEAEVPKFVKKMGDKMTYRVALDDKSSGEPGKMAETWMQAAGRNGIPSAFVVDKHGKIAWVGHPMELKEQLLEDVLADKFDVKKAAADYEQSVKNKAKVDAAWQKFVAGSKEEKWDEADAALDEMKKLLPPENHSGVEMRRFGLYLAKKDYAGAYKLAKTISESNLDNGLLQNDLAWQIAAGDTIEKRDLDLAETIAERANKAYKGEDANTLDTVARIAAMKGKMDKAVEWQKKAIERAGPEQKEHFRKSLKSYELGKVPAGE